VSLECEINIVIKFLHEFFVAIMYVKKSLQF